MIKTLLLKNGVEVVADVSELSDIRLLLKRPLRIVIASVPTQKPNGSINISSVPTMVPMVASCIEDTVSIDASDVAQEFTTTREMSAMYVKRTTGLDLAGPGVLA